MSNQLRESFKESLFSGDLKNVTVDLSETVIDSMTSNKALRSIPVVNVIMAATNIALDLHARNLLKQTATFIDAINRSNLTRKQLNQYRHRLDRKNGLDDELGRVLLILNSTIDDKKSIYLARAFAYYVKEQLDWEEFTELADIVSRLFLSDICIFLDTFKVEDIAKKTLIDDQSQILKFKRLQSIGLTNSEPHTYTFGNGPSIEQDVTITNLGIIVKNNILS